MNQEFRIQNIKETINNFSDQIEQSELMSKKNKKICSTSSYMDQFLILVSTATGSISISTFSSLLGIPIGIKSSGIKSITH